jgi:hypothetical protein
VDIQWDAGTMQGRTAALYGEMRGVLNGIEDHREGASGAVQQRAADLASITFVGSGELP